MKGFHGIYLKASLEWQVLKTWPVGSTFTESSGAGHRARVAGANSTGDLPGQEGSLPAHSLLQIPDQGPARGQLETILHDKSHEGRRG